MSREEAIEILSEMRAEYNLFGDEEEATRYHVLSWAIQAMKDTQIGDLIDRTETIRAWCKLTCGCEPEECGMTIEQDGAEECEFVEFLWNRPESENYVWDEWCTDCKEYDHEKGCCPRFNRVIEETVKEVREAHQEKHGRWVKLDMHPHLADHKCTACGESTYVPTCMGEPIYLFCPWCGAKMEGEEDATD